MQRPYDIVYRAFINITADIGGTREYRRQLAAGLCRPEQQNLWDRHGRGALSQPLKQRISKGS